MNRPIDYDEVRLWEGCVLAAIASGRHTGDAAVQLADKLVKERDSRYPWREPETEITK